MRYYMILDDPLWTEACRNAQCYNVLYISKKEHCWLSVMNWLSVSFQAQRM